MNRSFFPTQIGYIPTGTNAGTSISSVIIGRASGAFEGAGFGQQGRPDYAQIVQINMGDPIGDGTFVQRGSVTFNVNDLLNLQIGGSPSNIALTFREVAICSAGQNKKMIILSSAPY